MQTADEGILFLYKESSFKLFFLHLRVSSSICTILRFLCPKLISFYIYFKSSFKSTAYHHAQHVGRQTRSLLGGFDLEQQYMIVI